MPSPGYSSADRRAWTGTLWLIGGDTRLKITSQTDAAFTYRNPPPEQNGYSAIAITEGLDWLYGTR